MRVLIDVGLDLSGLHRFEWKPSEAEGALEVPRHVLDRWGDERGAFIAAIERWQCVVEEIEDHVLTSTAPPIDK